MVTPLCGVSSDEKPLPVKSRYLVPLMVMVPIVTVPPGVVLIDGFAAVTVTCSAAALFSMTELLLASPL